MEVRTVKKRGWLSSLVALVLVVLFPVFAVAQVGPETEPIVVSIAFKWPAAAAVNALEAAIEVFEQNNPDIKIEYITDTGDMPKVQTMIAGGVGPDLITAQSVHSPVYGPLMEPLDEYIEASGLRDKFPEMIWEPFIVDGVTYQLPAFEGGPRRGLIYNREHFDLAGLAYPSDERAMTWDEVGALAAKLTKVDGNGDIIQIGYHPRESDSFALYTMATQSWGRHWYNFETGRSELDQQWATDALEAIKRNFYDPWGQAAVDGFIQGRPKWPAQPGAPFPSGLSSMQVTGYYAIGELRITMPGGDVGATWIPTPTGKKHQSATAHGLAMMKYSKNKEAAWRVMEFFASAEASAIFYEYTGWLGGLHVDLPNHVDLSREPGLAFFLRSLTEGELNTNFPGAPGPVNTEANRLWNEAFEKGIRNEVDIGVILREGNKIVNQIASEL